jgi:hypothetical protein
MRQLRHPREALAGVALVVALFGGYVGASLVASAEAAPSAKPRATQTAIETEPTTAPQPSPDPAPPEPKPAPKPVTQSSPKAKTVTHGRPKPAPTGTNPAPVPTAQAPPHVSRPSPVAKPRQTYVATLTHPSKPVNRNPVVQPRRHKQRKPTAAPAEPASKAPSDVKAESVVSRDTDRRTFVIAGLVLASLLLLIPLALPAMGARFTSVGRAVMQHQTDFLLAGIGTLLVTAVVFFLTQGA